MNTIKRKYYCKSTNLINHQINRKMKKLKKMKRFVIAVAIACCIAPTTHAQSDQFFNWSDDARTGRDGTSIDITSPNNGGFGIQSLNQDPPTTPLGGGLLLLTAAGLGYVVIKRSANKKNDVL